MLNTLRLRDGFSFDLFERQTFLSKDTIQNNLQVAIDRGLLKVNKDNVKPTDKGYLFLNDCINTFI